MNGKTMDQTEDWLILTYEVSDEALEGAGFEHLVAGEHPVA